MKAQLLIVDPIAFRGGSKIATETMLSLLTQQGLRVAVLSADPHSWRVPGVVVYPLWMLPALNRASQGIAYFLRHFIMLLNALVFMVRIGRVNVLLGASGPGVDLSLYFLKGLTGIRLVQLIHGPVARSRTIGRCLRMADHVFYLASAKESVCAALAAVGASVSLNSDKYDEFINGLAQTQWPTSTTTSSSEETRVLWAASLLKWKGLDLLVEALKRFDDTSRPHTDICYLRPKDIALAVSDAGMAIAHVRWHESPNNLDQLRSQSNIFVSTSVKEPFGLSILEALAAGLCVVIPQDGAYWDTVLTDGVNCIKYTPNDSADLYDKLKLLSTASNLQTELARKGQEIARNYRAEVCYQRICEAIISSPDK